MTAQSQSSAHTVWRLTRSRTVPVSLCFACVLHGHQCTCRAKERCFSLKCCADTLFSGPWKLLRHDGLNASPVSEQRPKVLACALSVRTQAVRLREGDRPEEVLWGSAPCRDTVVACDKAVPISPRGTLIR